MAQALRSNRTKADGLRVAIRCLLKRENSSGRSLNPYPGHLAALSATID